MPIFGTNDDVAFDWDDPTIYAPAHSGFDRAYLVTPVARTRFAGAIADFLDLTIGAGVRHVNHLSTFGSDRAHRRSTSSQSSAIGHSILRPAWVIQNFADGHLPTVGGAIVVPTGGGMEAFVDAGDIAVIAVETLARPSSPRRSGVLAEPSLGSRRP